MQNIIKTLSKTTEECKKNLQQRYLNMKSRYLTMTELGSSDHDLGHCIVYSILSLEGPPFELRDITNAMNELGKRHPVLRATIIRDWRGAKKLSNVDEKTNVHYYRVFVIEKDTDPLQLVQQRLNVPMKNEGPLVFVYTFRHRPMDIVFATSHAIMDGRSIFMFASEFVQLLAGRDLGQQIIPPDNNVLHVHTHEQVKLLKLDVSKIELPIRKRSPSKSPVQFIPFDDDRDIRMVDVDHVCLLRSIEGAGTLAKLCREHKVTVHSAFVAALTACNQWHEQLKETTGNFVVASPVGLWDKLCKVHPRADEIQETLGNNFSLLENEFSVKEGDDFWDVARSYFESLKSSLDDAEYVMPPKNVQGIGANLGMNPYSSLKATQTVLDVLGPHVAPADVFLRKHHTAQRRRKITALVTNLGVCDKFFEATQPTYRVKSLPWFLSYTDPAPLMSVHTLNDTMYFGFTFKTPLFSKETAELIANDCMKTLEDIINKRPRSPGSISK
jgi:hypothetical protein